MRFDWARPGRMSLLALVVTTLVVTGCGAGSVSVGTKVSDNVEKSAAHGGPAELDLTAVKSQVDTSRFVRMRSTVTVDQNGESTPASQMLMTSDKKTKRTDMHMAANAQAQTKGITERTIGSNMYLKADGADTWVKLVIDPSLTNVKGSLGKSSNLLDSFAKMGTHLRRDGTATRDGRNLARYTGILDWDKYLATMKSTSELSNQFFSQMPPGMHVDGSVTALIEPSGAPRHLGMVLDMSKDAETARIVSSTDFLSTKGITGIDEPNPSDVAETVPVHLVADMQKEISSVMGGSGSSH